MEQTFKNTLDGQMHTDDLNQLPKSPVAETHREKQRLCRNEGWWPPPYLRDFTFKAVI